MLTLSRYNNYVVRNYGMYILPALCKLSHYLWEVETEFWNVYCIYTSCPVQSHYLWGLETEWQPCTMEWPKKHCQGAHGLLDLKKKLSNVCQNHEWGRILRFTIFILPALQLLSLDKMLEWTLKTPTEYMCIHVHVDLAATTASSGPWIRNWGK